MTDKYKFFCELIADCSDEEFRELLELTQRVLFISRFNVLIDIVAEYNEAKEPKRHLKLVGNEDDS